MSFQQSGGIKYFTFDSLSRYPIVHAVFTRRGGVSPNPWAALNVGGLVGDDPKNVSENRRMSFEALRRPLSSMYDVWQVHSRKVVCAQSPRPIDQPHIKADAILTDRPDITLFMRFADCVPILLYDPRRGVIGVVHAGWQGTVIGVAAAAVEEMQNEYRSNPAEILAAIGPSVCAKHYEVGEEVVSQVRQAFGTDAPKVLSHSMDGMSQGKKNFDLWTANRLILERSGVEQIEMADICTACHPEDWYSHRAEKGKTGRFGVLVGLKN
jgi:YfiH family protein